MRAKGEEDPEPHKIGDVDVQLYGNLAPAAVATFLAFALGDPGSAEAPTYGAFVSGLRLGAPDADALAQQLAPPRRITMRPVAPLIQLQQSRHRRPRPMRPIM